MKLPKLVITDIDGVWTDGGMYYTESGDEFKKFNTSDGAGVLFLKSMNIPMAIITGENSKIVINRAKKLDTRIIKIGIKDKLKTAIELCEELDIELAEVAFIGDDINDLNLLKAVGFSGCPANAPAYIKSEVDFITSKSGGQGAFREFVEVIFEKCGLMQQALTKTINSYKD